MYSSSENLCNLVRGEFSFLRAGIIGGSKVTIKKTFGCTQSNLGWTPPEWTESIEIYFFNSSLTESWCETPTKQQRITPKHLYLTFSWTWSAVFAKCRGKFKISQSYICISALIVFLFESSILLFDLGKDKKNILKADEGYKAILGLLAQKYCYRQDYHLLLIG